MNEVPYVIIRDVGGAINGVVAIVSGLSPECAAAKAGLRYDKRFQTGEHLVWTKTGRHSFTMREVPVVSSPEEFEQTILQLHS